MDLLRLNFPRMFKELTLGDVSEHANKYYITGDHGRTTSEQDSSSDVLICDQRYLDSLICKMNSIEMRLAMWELKCTRPGQSHDFKLPQDVLLREAFADLLDVTSHVQRLRDNPILFGDSRVQQHFFVTAKAIFTAIFMLIMHAVKADQVLSNAELREREATSSSPVFPGTSQRIPPWQSFCAPVAVNPEAEKTKEIEAAHPGYRLVQMQSLPAQGVLIAEHWRRKVESFVGGIAKASADPQLVLRQKPQPMDILQQSKRKCIGKVVAVRILKPTRMRSFKPEAAQHLAFGEQHPVEVGRSARLMAKLLREDTTLGSSIAVGSAVFIKDENVDHEVA
ncbi:hypothetical protein M409DRAFT_60189 [Zasmidium cellare ATCC 36951]|uniref:Uncharacterized protein n=1 Tax=Zasmidium cellare ATCC 36951 TaxID=1080233 RepID=A0A6A6C1X0_ZASCE|nr:uncharacterized protein M409DRAFT_60189 [Zasmidium cellare ATCC 36951]KAF2160288.1 hypothetical protein M409DRAFT_60189 [Zasmidium cellare ATCC 36951]